MPKRISINLNRLEELAATDKSQPEIAAELGIGFSTLCLYLKNEKPVRSAYERGRKIAFELGIAPKPFRKRKSPETAPPEIVTESSGKTAAAFQMLPVIENSAPDVSPLSVAEITEEVYDERALVKKAIRAGHNLVASIAEFTNLTRLETQKLLWEMREDRVVERREVEGRSEWFIRNELLGGRRNLKSLNGAIAPPDSALSTGNRAAASSIGASR